MLHKSFEILETKADAEAGTFEATVAVFGNVDRGGDRIQPGAFQKTLQKWQTSGDPIPVILSHQWADPMAHIGVVMDAKETDKGLWVKGQLDVADNPVARQVHKLMQRRSLKEFSFGYDVPRGGEKRAKDGANDLLELDLAEVGPTLKGMNPATELHAVKTALDEQNKPDPWALRKESDRLERELVEAKVADVPPAPPADPGPTLEERLTKQLQEITERLANNEQALNDLKKKAEETAQAPKGRAVDPLRKRSEELALEISSGGMSLRKPPAQVKTPDPDPAIEAELRTRSRDLMFEVLSYSTE